MKGGCLFFVQVCIHYLPGAGHSECLGTGHIWEIKDGPAPYDSLFTELEEGDSKCAERQIAMPQSRTKWGF